MLKKLKSLFIVEEEGSGSKQPNTTSKSKSAPKTSTSKKTPTTSSATKPVAGKPQEKFINILLEAVEKNNLEGFDYLEYKQSLQSLSKMNMDEQTRFQSAFAMASTMGIDKAKLVNSVKHYLSVLKKEEVKFNQALNNQINQKVGQRKSDLKRLADTILSKENQIKKLKEEIEKHKKQLQEVKDEIGSAESKVDGTKSSFYGSYKVVVSQMEEDLNKINQYL